MESKREGEGGRGREREGEGGREREKEDGRPRGRAVKAYIYIGSKESEKRIKELETERYK